MNNNQFYNSIIAQYNAKMGLEDFVHGAKHKFFGENQPTPTPKGIPQARGEERDKLITVAGGLTSAENFDHQNFADFIMAMRGLVGLIRPDHASNALPYDLDKGYLYGFLEFNKFHDIPTIDALHGTDRNGIDPYRGTVYLQPGQTTSDFDLKVPLPIGPHSIFYYDQLLNLADEVTFRVETRPVHHGKGGLEYAWMQIPSKAVQGFCVNILEHFQAISPIYEYVNADLLIRRLENQRGRFS